MAETVNGAKLAKCFEIVSAAGKEITALTETLDNLISRKLAQFESAKIIDEKIPSERWDEEGWVYTDVAHSFPIMRPRAGRKKPDMYFGYQVSLCGDGMAASNNAEPLLHVFLWPNSADFDDGYYMIFPVEHEPWQLRNGVLIDEGPEKFPAKWTEQAWTFSLRLVTLNSLEDLEKRVMEPALALLRGESPDVALPANLPGLVHYRIAEDGSLAVAT